MSESTSTGLPTTVRELVPSDAHEMRRLFAHIFKKDMTQAHWDWKYARPQSAALGVWRGDELVAHYGGMGLDIWYMGVPGRAVEICDVMVDTSARQAVRKTSPFFLSTSAFLERYLGFDNPFMIGFGFPSDRHMALAAHLKLYAPVGKMAELTWELDMAPRIPWLLKTEAVTAATLARHRNAIDALSEQQRDALPDRILIRKNTAFVDWRFLQHPHERYELLLVKHRLTGKAIGLCVLKVEAERVLWMDAVAPVAHLPALAQVARAATWRLERRKLSVWCSAPDVMRFGTGAHTQVLDITTPTNIWTPGPLPEDIKDRWWLVAGDTDYL